ncbi:MAG: sulfatase [Kiritimatiellales bacterium]|nr:sulfatase [Kiritimatiellales bacterium]
MTKQTRLLALLVLLSMAGAANAAGKKEQMNILFMMSDDHAVQSIGCFGTIFEKYNPTPNLDQLAAEGVTFVNTFVNNSICSPSRAAFLTGKYSHNNGVRAWEEFDGSQQTFPKLLQKAGYHTVLIGKWHLKSDPTGFDEWMILPGQGDYFDPTFLDAKHDEKNPIQKKGYVAEIITRMAKDAIRNREKNKPLAIFVHHKSVHIPFLCDPRDKEWLKDETLPEPATLRDDWKGRPAIVTANNKVPNIEMLHKRFDENGIKEKGKKRYADSAEKGMEIQERNTYRYQYYLKSYLRTARSIDRSMGELMQVLKDEKIDNKTTVVYTSDQGFYLGEHGMSDKRWAYEESVRTPLIIKHPYALKGIKVEALAMNIDLAPTLLLLSHIKIPSDMQGRHLVSFLAGMEPKAWRDHVYYRYYDSHGYNIPQHQAVRTQTHKLIYFPLADRYELFDLKADPVEMKNLADNPEQRELLEKMKKKLVAAKKEAGDKDEDIYPIKR